MKIDIPDEIRNYFSSYKAKFNPERETSDHIEAPIIGKLWWNSPDDVIWLWTTDNYEGYEGSQTQIGVKKDGTLVWSYFSHCSCYYYHDNYEDYNELKNEDDFKSYKLKNIPEDIEDEINDRLTELLKEGIKE